MIAERINESDGVAPAAPDIAGSILPISSETLQAVVGKRSFDIVLSLLLLLPLTLIILVVGAILLISQGRPIFYVAQRMQSPHKTFSQLKFRTMRRVEQDSGASGAHKNWRITTVGHFLRRTRLDELPQLFNILRGDMSFVGPRPPLREYVERFPREYARVLQMRPGVTGLATLIYHAHEDRIMASCGTAEATERTYHRRCLPTKLHLDLIYLRRRSFSLDMWIIWNTLMTVITPGWKRTRWKKDPVRQNLRAHREPTPM